MMPRDTVPRSTGAIVHAAGELEGGAVDVFAPPGSGVHAPGDGRVVDTMPAPIAFQVRGYMKRRDGKEVPFVAAHLITGTYPTAGKTFKKGEVIGHVARWSQDPRSSHVHWAFRKTGSGMPPPGNVLVLKAFERFGRRTW